MKMVKYMDYVLLKSLDEDTYKDIIVSCEFLDKDALKDYIKNSKDVYIGKKVAPVKIRKGKKGEIVKTRLLTSYNDISSLSQEEYIIDPNFLKEMIKLDNNMYSYKDTPRKLIKADKNISFMTSFGEKAVCLKDSYIVIYDDDVFNTLEKTAADYTYEIKKT